MISGILLSGGTSARMGTCKALLPLHNSTLLEHIAGNMLAVCDTLVIVSGAHHQLIMEYVQKSPFFTALPVTVVENVSYQQGMFSSLQCGLTAVNPDHWAMYHFADQPGLPRQFYLDFAGQISRQSQWIQPVQNGRRGHPVLIHPSLFPVLLQQPASITMREILHNITIDRAEWQYNGTGLFTDLDTPEEYQKFLSQQ